MNILKHHSNTIIPKVNNSNFLLTLYIQSVSDFPINVLSLLFFEIRIQIRVNHLSLIIVFLTSLLAHGCFPSHYPPPFFAFNLLKMPTCWS